MNLIQKFFEAIESEGLLSATKKTINYIGNFYLTDLLNRIFKPNITFNPLVSVIAVNYNGSKDLEVFLKSILLQSYKKFELIIVDNNSSDNSRQIIGKYSKKHKNISLLKSNKNLGFAGGNNYALPYCNGDLFALINVDTRVDVDWLKELVDAMSKDGDCGAVCSKTLFFERFQDVEIHLLDEFQLDAQVLLDSLTYKKFFIRKGFQRNNLLHSVKKKMLISLPIQNTPIQLGFTKDENEIRIKIGKNPTEYYSKASVVNLDFTQENVINSSYIVNNAGSVLKNGMPADRGIGKYDVGQYDEKSYVDFFCGVSVLLRRSLLIDRKIFVSEFFAYYEDSELSRYIQEMGFKILYTHRSIVYHRHSATSTEGSPLWQLLVSRSRRIYRYNGNYDQLKNDIDKIEHSFKNNVNTEFYSMLREQSNILFERLKQKNTIVEKNKPIGIYNSNWNTKGGGESHALSFATILQKYETVYLISETDFSIAELSEYFHVDLSNCRKIVLEHVTSAYTKKFKIFINSTYRSNLSSQADQSFYIVSFPHKRIRQKVLKSYSFWYNSDFTQKWSIKYWGKKQRGKIIYPLGMLNLKSQDIPKEKQKIILSVGRFFKSGHSKNQHIIAEAFKKLKNKNWQLVLIGSVDTNSKKNMRYIQEIKDILQETNYKILTNAKNDQLKKYYDIASIYVHATGFGENIKKRPENFEHFGITPIEAMSRGCYPIVYQYGGPAETLKKLEVGETFDSIDDLVVKMNDAVKASEDKTIVVNEIINSVKKFVEENEPTKQINMLFEKNEASGKAIK